MASHILKEFSPELNRVFYRRAKALFAIIGSYLGASACAIVASAFRELLAGLAK